MTNYGTIPTSSGTGGSNIDYITRAHERIKEGLGTRRPWRQMLDLHAINFTAKLSDVVSRIKVNLAFFQMNYALIVLGVIFLSLLWNPISLIVFIVLMAAWTVFYFLRDEPLVIFGRLITDRAVLIILSILTVVLLLFTHAVLNIVVSVAVGIAVVVAHAALRRTDDLQFDEEAGGLLSSGPSSSS